jgi:hypothetical protein
MSIFFQLELPPDSMGKHLPYVVEDCDLEGGDPSTIAPGGAVSAFLNGYLPLSEEDSLFRHSLFWPSGMAPGAVFPEESSKYLSNGIEYDVECYVPGEASYSDKFDCPMT